MAALATVVSILGGCGIVLGLNVFAVVRIHHELRDTYWMAKRSTGFTLIAVGLAVVALSVWITP